MSIIIGADLVPTKSNQALFAEGNVEALIGGKLKMLLQEADFRIFNLEVPLADQETPIAKCGPNLIAPTNTVAAIKEMGVDLFTLGNNHIMDQGVQGLASTCSLLEENGIAYVGVGDTLSSAFAPYIFVWHGKKVGVYACAEHEFSIATENAPGANPFDPLESMDHIVALKEQCDYVIVLYHGGKEHYRYPSPSLQKVCRKLVDKGADLVVCQHSHCIGCEEKYNGATIVYGQGNFLFDLSQNEFWQTGVLIRIEDDFSISYIPLMKEGSSVRAAEDDAAKEILSAFATRSEAIKVPGYIEENYKEFAQESFEKYLLSLHGKYGFLLRVLNKITGYRFMKFYMKKKYRTENLLAIRNFIECEAHRELLLMGIK